MDNLPKPAIHVVPRGKLWAVRIEGRQRARRIVKSRNDAIEIGRILAKKMLGLRSLFVFNVNGRIDWKETYD